MKPINLEFDRDGVLLTFGFNKIGHAYVNGNYSRQHYEGGEVRKRLSGGGGYVAPLNDRTNLEVKSKRKERGDDLFVYILGNGWNRIDDREVLY